MDRNPDRWLFQPERRAHQQPVVQLEAGAPEPMRAADSTAGAMTPEPSVWESDWSDHSEWENDWLDDETKVITPTAATPRPQSPPVPPSSSQLTATTRDLRIAEAIQHLGDNHACDHDRWLWVKGRHICEECRHVLKEYIFECKQCHLQACNRCRRNRL